MQTIYYRTSNFIRHEGNLVDLEVCASLSVVAFTAVAVIQFLQF